MLRIAKIVKSNGTDGGILLSVRDFDLSEINVEEPVYIYFDGLPVPFFILDLCPRGRSRAIVHLNDVLCLGDAEELVGREVWIDGEPEDETEEDFTGWTLLDKGRSAGIVTGVEPIPGNLCLYVGDTLVPLHEDLVISIDPEARVLDLNLPEGLLP